MAKRLEFTKKVSPENKKPADSKAVAENTLLTKAPNSPYKLKLAIHYLMRVSPILAVLAIIVALIAINENLSSRTQLNALALRVDRINKDISASKDELEKLNVALLQAKAMREDEHKKQEELLSDIILDVTNLQLRLKIYPTLDEQMIQRASAASAAKSASGIASGKTDE